ncbi:hypothetical protein D9M72_546000 [compost metagenome]
MRGEEVADLGDVHPGQQIGIAGGIGASIRRRAGHLQVNGANLLDQPVGVLPRTEGGAGDELPGAAQATEHVLTKIRMVPDPGQCQRVQGLQHQGTDATDQHAAEIAMDLPAHRVWPEQPGVALGVFQVEFAQRQTGQAHDLGFDAGADEFHGDSVGASLLAMVVNGNAFFLNTRGALEFIASKLAPTKARY